MPAAADRIELEGLGAVALRAGELEAAFVPGAGLVGASLRHRGEELLGLRRGLRAYAERGSTMGIPLLHPWANRLEGDDYEVAGRRVQLGGVGRLRRDPAGLPIHGLAWGVPDWRVGELEARGESASVVARLDVSPGSELYAGFPFAHELEVRATLTPAALAVETVLHASAAGPVPVAFGWHPYLRLPGAPRPEWRVALPARRHLVSDERGLPTGESEPEPAEEGPLADRTFDDGYGDLAPAAFRLAGGGRTLGVTFERGYPVAQVYAPPDEDVVCFEPMTAPTNALASGHGLRLVEPGEAFTAAFGISVR